MSNKTELENTNGFSLISNNGPTPSQIQENAEDPDKNHTSATCTYEKHADDEPFISFKGQSSFLGSPQKNKPRQKFPCGICQKQLSSKGALYNHIAVLHAEEKPYACYLCQKRFSIRRCLAQHMNTHARQKLRELRKTGCELSEKLLLPRRNCGSRPGYEPFECDVCGQRFAWQYKLSRHFRLAHDDAGERPFVCSVCGERFGFEKELNDHQLQSHGENFACDFCEAKFEKKSELDSHLRSHTAEEGFECVFCKKKFRIKSKMSLHLRKHTGETPYECDVCLRKFLSYSKMQWHKRKHT